MYRSSGETAIAPGVYHSTCRCVVELRVRKGDVFPPCPRCTRAIGWTFTRSIYADVEPPRPEGLRPHDDGRRPD